MKKQRIQIVKKHFGSFKYFISISQVIILIFAMNCGGNKNNEDKETSGITFKSDPQKIEKHEIKTIEIGEKAYPFNLPDVSGRFYTLEDFSDADVLVIVFTCNHCPTAQAYEDRIIRFVNDYKDKNVALVAIMPNSEYSLLLEECSYSDLDDSYESMIIRAKDKGYNFPYLYDGDNHSVSVQYGPTATPHAFVFNKGRVLTYKGRLDDSEKPGTANAEDLRTAVDQTIPGETVKTPVAKVFGCSIKWAWKTEWTDKVNNEWKEKPVTLEKMDAKGIRELMKNNSEKLRLVNVWATWCGPCIIEYPELLIINRMYCTRDFEFVSVSADKPGNSDKVLKFLENQHSAVQNLLFDSKDKYALIDAIDPEWNGSLPYTMLIEPGGKVIYSATGAVDLMELKRAIIEHPMMGRYY